MRVLSHLTGYLIVGYSILSFIIGSAWNPSSSIEFSENIAEDTSEKVIVKNTCRERDSLILVDFYMNARGMNWIKQWDLTQPMDTWFGITVNKNHCVTCIDLDGEEGSTISVSFGNGLTGIISEAIGGLDSLESLLLGNNMLSGRIPESLFELKALSVIDLFANDMIGPLPANLGHCCNMHTLSMAGNNIDGEIPPGIGDLGKLENFYLDNNQLTGKLPIEIGKATSLKRIRLHNNKLEGDIPNEIGTLIEMRSINLAENNLDGTIPSEIGNLVKMQDLILANNELSDIIPVELGNLTELRRLRLCHNNFIGPLPLQLGNLTAIEQLWANDNNLEGTIPIEMGNCRNLSDFRLDLNQLTGPIPEEIGNMISLRKVNFSHNKLIGPLPQNLDSLVRLQELIISNNLLTGPLPERIGSLRSAKVIKAENNSFIGPLPSSVSNLGQLQELQLANNEIDGTIPEEYGNVESLVRLNLTNNKLEGCFPESLKSKCDRQYKFDENPELPWLGDFSQFCDGLDQVGAKCSSETGATGESIQDDCSCSAYSCSPVSIVQDAFICDNESINFGNTTHTEAGQFIDSLTTQGGCDSIVTLNIAKLTLDVRTTSATCTDDTNGSVYFDTDWTGNYDYVIYDNNNNKVDEGQDASGSPSLENMLAPGQYKMVLSEGNFECDVIREFEITAAFSAIEPTYLDEIKCEGEVLQVGDTVYNEDNSNGEANLKSVNGCDSLVVIDLSYLTMDQEVRNVHCANENTGQIIANASVDRNDYTYIILNEAGTEIAKAENQNSYFESENILAPGRYTLIMDAPLFGCMYETVFEITSQEGPSEPYYIEQKLCPGETLIVNNVEYSEDNTEGSELLLSELGCDSLVYIQLEYISISSATDDLHIYSDEISAIDILSNDNIDPDGNMEITILEQEYVDDVFINEDLMMEVRIDESYSGTSTILYEICTTDCEEICSRARVIVQSESGDGYDEQILTPNEDGYNDVLVVSGYTAYETIPNCRINIVNRWGQVVYNTSNYSNDWSGCLDGNQSKPLPEGVYYYHLIYNSGKTVMGSRSLIR